MKNTLEQKKSSLKKLKNLEPITFIDKTDGWEEQYVYNELKEAYETKENGWFIVPLKFLYDVANNKYLNLEII